MQGYGTDTYGERWADIYDSWFSFEHGEEKSQRTAAVLAELAPQGGGGTVLELAIGTGRVALPLAAPGLAGRPPLMLCAPERAPATPTS